MLCRGDVSSCQKQVRLNGVPMEAMAAENTIEILLTPADSEISGVELALYWKQTKR